MVSEPRVWKWMVPAIVMVAMLPLGEVIKAIAERNDWSWLLWCNYLVYGLMSVFGLQAWAAYQAYYRHLAVEDFVDERNALNTTAETRLFEFAHTMHPETVRLLLMHRKIVWRVKQSKLRELVDWVLDADPRVHVNFVEYVLQGSTQYAMMPMSRFSDKLYDFDPERLVTDYEQYRALHRIFVNKLMATEAHGNMPGQWVEPWTPELLARQFGIVLEEEEEALEVPKVDEAAEVPKVSEVSKVPEARKITDDAPTEKELEAVRLENENYSRQFGSDVKSYLEFQKNKKEK